MIVCINGLCPKDNSNKCCNHCELEEDCDEVCGANNPDDKSESCENESEDEL